MKAVDCIVVGVFCALSALTLASFAALALGPQSALFRALCAIC